jgi:hypothetical protein
MALNLRDGLNEGFSESEEIHDDYEIEVKSISKSI